MKHRKRFSHLEKIDVNRDAQWVLVRGQRIDAPLLIHVQQGPGLPMISEANEMERLLHLEDNFLVAYWDQRGSGKSFSKDLSPASLTLSQLADDVLVLTRYLLKKYNKQKAVIAGYSIGATVSLMAAAKDSSLFSALFLTGIDVDIPFADVYALQFAMKNAIALRNQKMIQKISELQREPILESKRFQQRAQILTDLGAIKAGSSFNQLLVSTVKNILFSRYYGIGGLIRTMKGMAFSQNAMIPELNSFSLFQKVTKVEVPVHFIQGSLDGIAPMVRGRAYYDQLQAVDKRFTVFERSAHTPQYDEPEKFAKLLNSFLHQ